MHIPSDANSMKSNRMGIIANFSNPFSKNANLIVLNRRIDAPNKSKYA
jgi:hypothetical protein